jgi:hypothetical protein
MGRHKSAGELYKRGLKLDENEAEMMLNLPGE